MGKKKKKMKLPDLRELLFKQGRKIEKKKEEKRGKVIASNTNKPKQISILMQLNGFRYS